jgi:predicted DNA-binding transcriptional regulator AlpA
MEGARGLSGDAFVRFIKSHGVPASELVSLKDLAAELGVSVRTLWRWNKRADAPKRFKKNGRSMCRRADVQHWFEQRARRLGATQAGDESD